MRAESIPCGRYKAFGYEGSCATIRRFDFIVEGVVRRPRFWLPITLYGAAELDT
jgi:hypothetical protein